MSLLFLCPAVHVCLEHLPQSSAHRSLTLNPLQRDHVGSRHSDRENMSCHSNMVAVRRVDGALELSRKAFAEKLKDATDETQVLGVGTGTVERHAHSLFWMDFGGFEMATTVRRLAQEEFITDVINKLQSEASSEAGEDPFADVKELTTNSSGANHMSYRDDELGPACEKTVDLASQVAVHISELEIAASGISTTDKIADDSIHVSMMNSNRLMASDVLGNKESSCQQEEKQETCQPGNKTIRELESFHPENGQAEQSSMTKPIWIRFGGKTRPISMRTGSVARLEKEIREKMELGEKTEVYLDRLGNLDGVEEDQVVDVGLTLKGGVKKKKKKIVKNPWNSSESEVERSETDKSGEESLGWEACRAVLDEVLDKTKKDGKPMKK